MKRTNCIRLRALLLCLGCSAIPVARAQGTGGLVMVASKTSPASETSKADAKKLLLGLTTSWPGGVKVVVVLRAPGNPDRTVLLQKLCGMAEAEYTRYEMQLVFTGHTASKVQEEASEVAIKSFLKANPGAVGFMHEGDVDGDLKTLLAVN